MTTVTLPKHRVFDWFNTFEFSDSGKQFTIVELMTTNGRVIAYMPTGMMDWLNHHGGWEFNDHGGSNSDGHWSIRFQSDETALLFKLTWL